MVGAVLALLAVAILVVTLKPFDGTHTTDPDRRDLRVLVAIDTSGSMIKPVSRNDSLRRIDAAVGGAQAGVSKLNPPFELGIWTFRQSGHTALAPIKPAKPSGLMTLSNKLGALAERQRRHGGTPLYNTIAAGLDALQLAALRDVKPEATINALVVLTDGKDHPPRAMIRAGSAKTATELNSALADADDIRVLVTAAFARCASVFADIPTLEENCLSVSTADDIEQRLTDVLARLEAGR